MCKQQWSRGVIYLIANKEAEQEADMARDSATPKTHTANK